MRIFEPMRDIYEPLYDFLVFNRGNEVSKAIGFLPVDNIVLDSVQDNDRQATAKLFLHEDGVLKDLSLEAVFNLDKEGIPTGLKLQKYAN